MVQYFKENQKVYSPFVLILLLMEYARRLDKIVVINNKSKKCNQTYDLAITDSQFRTVPCCPICSPI